MTAGIILCGIHANKREIEKGKVFKNIEQNCFIELSVGRIEVLLG